MSEFALRSTTVIDFTGEESTNLHRSQEFAVEIVYSVRDPLPFCRVGFELSTIDGSSIFEVYDVDEDANRASRTPGDFISRCEIPGDLLNDGRYIISINVGIPGVKNLVYLDGALELTMHDHSSSIAAMSVRRSGVIRPRLKWTQLRA